MWGSNKSVSSWKYDSFMGYPKIVIWGHKPTYLKHFGLIPRNRHTHSYIHEGYYRAFQYLGFDTFWFDDDDDVSTFDFKGALFLTEAQVQDKIPLLPSASYVIHHAPSEKYFEVTPRVLNLGNYTTSLEQATNFYFPGSPVEKISEVAYIDQKNSAIFQPWATNLLPFEIRTDSVVQYDSTISNLNYIGTTKHEDLPEKFATLRTSLSVAGVNLKTFSNINEMSAQQLVESSRVSIDIRGDWHRQCGYIPCRIWKSISYGKYVGSNSPKLGQIFGDFIHINGDEAALFDTMDEAYMKISIQKVRESMKWVKHNHTYVNRARTVMQTLEDFFY